MKKIHLIMLATGLLLASCITQTITDFEYFTVQIPVLFNSEFKNRESPDTSRDFSNLFSYSEYRDNKEKIDAAYLFQFNYRIDSLVMVNGIPFNPNTDDLYFDYVKFSLQFATPKFGNIYSKDSVDFMPDPNSPRYVLGEFRDVNVKDYYKKAYHILTLDEPTMNVISNTLKKTPYFFIYTEYSKIKGQTTEKVVFPYINSKYDVVVRLKVKL